MKTKHLYALVAVLALAISVGVAFTSHRAICPEDIVNDDEHLAAMDAWTNSFYDSHPGASLTEWAAARRQFYIDNHCTESLRRYEEAKTGNADPKTMETIKSVIRDVIQQ